MGLLSGIIVTGGSSGIDRATVLGLVRGNIEIMSGTGRTVVRVQTARLCRCGGSANKPFCDDTHKRIGFQAP